MIDVVRVLKLLSDKTRLRIFMLLSQKELCVCQIMGVLGVSQPLVSRNLSLLNSAGLLDERREGKLVFYAVRKRPAPVVSKLLSVLKTEMEGDKRLMDDLSSLSDCYEFQKKTGKCDMKTFLSFMEKKRAKK